MYISLEHICTACLDEANYCSFCSGSTGKTKASQEEPRESKVKEVGTGEGGDTGLSPFACRQKPGSRSIRCPNRRRDF